MADRNRQLKIKGWDISIPLPAKPEPNTIFIIKDEDEFFIEVSDNDCNYLTQNCSSNSSNEYGNEINIFEQKDVITTSLSTLKTVIQENTQTLPIGKYSIKVEYSWNCNCTQTDFESYLLFDNQSVTIDSTGLIHKEEPKDAKGNWKDTGSKQFLNFSREYIVDITSTGPKPIELNFKPSKLNTKVSIWNVLIKIIRIN